ncbi:hypothetical protein DV736_g6705, partial [Chaetothyriales sp. CBS 134916]
MPNRKTLVHPDKYKGKNLKEFKVFTYKCEVNFRRDPSQFATEELRILYPISLCEGEPLDRWSEHEVILLQQPTWIEFKTFLETLIAHPENRRIDMERKWREAAQKPNQSVKEFVLYLEGIAPYIDGLSDERKATHLLLGLRKPIANVILTQPVPIHSYKVMQRMAERIEMTQRGTAGESASDAKTKDSQRPKKDQEKTPENHDETAANPRSPHS